MMDLISVLIKENLVTKEQVNDARDKQAGAKKPLHELLVDMGFLKEEDLMHVSSRIYNMPILKLEDETIDTSVIKMIPCEIVKRYGVFPLRREKDVLDNPVLVLATTDPSDLMTLDYIRLLTGMDIRPVLCAKSEISKFIEKYYHLDDILYDLIKNVNASGNLLLSGKGMEVPGAGESDSPIINLTNFIFMDAVKARASDIHIEPRENLVAVRYRIDGNLKNIVEFPSKIQAYLIAHIKVMASLDITENRKPQDGRSSFFAENRKIDLRISVLPTHFGEKIVIRLLDANLSKTDLERIGFSPEELEIFRDSITKPQGMILVTGPTGSGKTSTLYAALNYIKSETRNIVTIEDPIEYLIDGINQIQVNPAIKFGFAEALRSILRQDPNVILVGEIRDAETAGIAFKASLTGHLVFSTLHTNNSVGTLTRLFDMGLEPFLISSSVVLIIAQRLVRTICPHCKKEYQPDPKIIEKFKAYIEQAGIKAFYKGMGCQECVFSGFLGRAPIFEVLKVTEKIKILIAKSSSEDVILKEAKDSGFHLLAESGIRKVADGSTTLEEVVRVAEVMEEGAEGGEGEKIPPERVKPCVLVVDDEPDVLTSFQRRLVNEGFDVVTAKDGQEAIESAFNARPDIILMDIKMPVLDGFEATKILRARLETAAIPLIMITAKADKESELKGFDSGADDYIAKPVDFEKLLARMRMLLRRRGQKSPG